MTNFLACIFTLLQICVMPSLAIIFPPKNLTVGLLDFKATAEWLPGKGNPPDSRYTLEFITAQEMSGRKWNRSPNCTNIKILKCELTFNMQAELNWNYFVRVKTTFKNMSSNWTTTSKSFQPYGDTRLSSPDVKISTEQKSIKIDFSHWLELKPEIKPLEYLLYLLENSPAGESTFLALISTSESPFIFHDVSSGKNYCVSVSASHQQVLKYNNFNTTKCIFVLDSTRSFRPMVWIVATLLIISAGILFSFGYFYHMRHKNKNPHIPNPLVVFPGYKWVLKLIPEEYQKVTVTPPKTVKNTDGYLFYEPTSFTNVTPPEQAVEADTSNQCYKNTLTDDLEDSEDVENVISEEHEENIHPGSESESGSSSTCTLNYLRSSKILQTVIMNTFVNLDMIRYYAEETISCSSGNGCEREVPAEEEVDFSPDFSSDSGYEPR
ncbi:interferon lambda receptor 1-like [Carassius gibelio]|uniref:interferon lambda receptor 1-like n=1 Tax=Carassius gibelio TaxID=101364 RepID=UPI002277A1D2|nr:interferon lambda receptor 1-like [Carassius gibelio]